MGVNVMKSQGIDYGMGQTNIDKKTGIRFGVINPYSLMPEALDDIYTIGRNLSFEAALQELHDEGKTEDEAYEILEDWESDGDDFYFYEADGYIIETSSLGLGLYIIKSPYKTKCVFCSPCCPGAGDLNTPSDEGIETYCLGPDWFDEDSPMPYDVEKV